MRAEAQWRPTKFVLQGRRWRASRDTAHVGRGSRVIGDLQALAYSQTLARHARGDLLDLGCGHVPAYGMYRASVDSVTCVDWAQTLHPSPHLDHEADLTQRLPLADASYDTIVLTDVLEHIPYPDRLFTEMTRVLRPGGRIVVGVPFLYWLHERPHDHHRYTEFRLRLFCADHGLAVRELFPYGGAGAVLLDVASKALGSTPLTRPVAGLPAVVVPKRRPPAQTPMPLGYVLVAERVTA